MIDKTQAFNLSSAEAAEISRSIEQMRKDQEEIDRLKAETRVMLEKLKAA